MIQDFGQPGYRGDLSKNAVTLAEVLQRLAELHKMIVQTEEQLSTLKREYAALRRKL